MKPVRWISVLLVSAFTAACGGGGDSPESVAGDWVEAMKAQDYDAACEVMSTAAQEATADCPSMLESSAATDVTDDAEVTNVREEGETASADVIGSTNLEISLGLVKEDDEWRIDQIVPAVSESA